MNRSRQTVRCRLNRGADDVRLLQLFEQPHLASGLRFHDPVLCSLYKTVEVSGACRTEDVPPTAPSQPPETQPYGSPGSIADEFGLCQYIPLVPLHPRPPYTYRSGDEQSNRRRARPGGLIIRWSGRARGFKVMQGPAPCMAFFFLPGHARHGGQARPNGSSDGDVCGNDAGEVRDAPSQFR